MDINDIRKLIANDKHQRLELKKTTGELKDAMHISYPYNPIMADVLFKTTFLENWGSGAGRIIDACRAQNVPEPEWRMQGGFIVVTFRYPEKKGASSEKKEPSSDTKGCKLILKRVQVIPNNYPTSNTQQVKTNINQGVEESRSKSQGVNNENTD